MTGKRVTCFFDWQNVYMWARRSFGDPERDPSTKGQVNPADLAWVLTKRHEQAHPDVKFELHEIRIYRGRPQALKEPGSYDAFQRQTSRWRENNKIVADYRDLRYPDEWGMPGCVEKPREKGVDVALAVDLVTLSESDGFDTAIVMSVDFDLAPALDFVVRRHLANNSRPNVAVAAWKGKPIKGPQRLGLKNKPLACYWLTEADYWGIEDKNDYTKPIPKPSDTRPLPGSWLQR